MQIDERDKPAKVGQAVVLLYASLGIGVIRAGLESSALTNSNAYSLTLGYVALFQVCLVAFCWWTFQSISSGKNWARILFLVFFSLGLPLSIKPLVHSLSDHPFSGSLGILQLLFQFIAVVFLFLPTAGAWFGRRNPKRSQK
jgi:hypothetical protein